MLLFLIWTAGLLALRVYVSSQATCDVEPVKTGKRPFVSILIPICNEPPSLVIETLRSALGISYDNFEVIVLDNNTTDPAVWRPVEAFCRDYDRLRFFHFDQLDGFKAGALNVCLTHIDPRTEFVLVLDADYQVKPTILKTALRYISDERVALVQFPQAYRHVSTENSPLACEYDHFFSVYMPYANRCDYVLSTGTVSLIRKAALDAVGGWGTTSITEDVELGLKLYGAGYRGVYVNKRVGHGLMPGDFSSLRKQRLRWVFGNMQVLQQLFAMPRHQLSARQRLSAVATLTAWFNPFLIPAAALLTGAVAYAVAPRPALAAMMGLCVLICWLTAAGRAVFFWQVGRKKRWGTRVTATAFLVHLGLLWESSIGWLGSLLGQTLPFERTNKFLGSAALSFFSPSLYLTIALLCSGIGHVAFGAAWLGLAILLTVPLFATTPFAAQQTSATQKLLSGQASVAAKSVSASSVADYKGAVN